jgi:membrane-associated phospholipid phosphatase
MWFLRPWKRIVAALTAVNVVLVAAILLLEWHYLVDVLGGVVVAMLAVLVVNREAFRRRPASTPSP